MIKFTHFRRDNVVQIWFFSSRQLSLWIRIVSIARKLKTLVIIITAGVGVVSMSRMKNANCPVFAGQTTARRTNTWPTRRRRHYPKGDLRRCRSAFNRPTCGWNPVGGSWQTRSCRTSPQKYIGPTALCPVFHARILCIKTWSSKTGAGWLSPRTRPKRGSPWYCRYPRLLYVF